MKIRILLFFTIIMACEKSPLERDVEIFTDSNVMLDSMVNEHEKDLATVKWRKIRHSLITEVSLGNRSIIVFCCFVVLLFSC